MATRSRSEYPGRWRRTLTWCARTAIVASLLAAGAACNAPARPTPDTGDDVYYLDASRVEDFHSVDELARRSIIVAIVRATPKSTVEVIEKFPFTVTVVEVIRSIRGTRQGAQLQIRQTGADKVILIDSPPLLEAGKVYLLFLDVFKWSEHEVTDQYVVTGIAGQFEQTSSGGFKRQDPSSPDLPETIMESDALDAVAKESYVPWTNAIG